MDLLLTLHRATTKTPMTSISNLTLDFHWNFLILILDQHTCNNSYMSIIQHQRHGILFTTKPLHDLSLEEGYLNFWEVSSS